MNFKEDCYLCDNVKTDLQAGIICNLTNQKPEFNNTCPKIKLGNKFEKKIGLVHIKIERLKKKKISTYIYFGICIVIGLLLILSQRNLLDGFDFTYSKYMKLAGALLVVFPGFWLINIAFSKLNNYRKNTKIVKEEKRRMDVTLDKYQIKYSYNIKFGKKYHGVQDVTIELKSNNNLLKDSKTTFQI